MKRKGTREDGRLFSNSKTKRNLFNNRGSNKNFRHKINVNDPKHSNAVRVSIGIHAVKEALKVSPSKIIKLYFKTNWESSKELKELMQLAKKHQISTEERASEALDKIGSQNQGIVCEIKNDQSEKQILDIGVREDSIVLILDGIEDPHNLGAILRTSWLMGVEAIILPTDRAVGLTTTVHKVSCGGIEHVSVIKVPNLGVVMEHLKKKGFWIYGLSSEGAKPIGQLKISKKVAWVLGAEDRGIRTTTEKSCDEMVFIPQIDNAASYNVSVAAAITLYETKQQSNSEKV